MTSGKVATTVGYERRYNPSLRIAELAAFVEHMVRDQPPRPSNMANIVAINQGLRPYATREPQVAPIAAADAAKRIEEGHAVVDVRSHEAFGEAHVRGSLNAQLASPGFEQNVGWILPGGRPFLLVAEAAEQARRAAHKLAFVGLDGLARGFLDFAAWRAAGLPLAGVAQIDVAALERELGSNGMRVLDVREAGEWDGGHIAAAVHANFRHLPRLLRELPYAPDEPIAVVCGGGMRSSTACSILLDGGFRNVRNVRGGMSAWREAGLPVVTT